MHEKCDFNEKEMVFRSYLSLEAKTLEDLRKKTKKFLDWIGRGEKVRKSIKSFLK